jgi:hypothetical protein
LSELLQEKIKEVRELREFYLEGIEYVHTHVSWLLDNYKKYGIKIEDIECLERLCDKSGFILENNSPTESQQRNKTTDEETEPIFYIILSLMQ